MAAQPPPTYPQLVLVHTDPSGGGVSVHNLLSGRSAATAHPISAITNLTESLAAIFPRVKGVLVLDDYTTPTEAIVLGAAPGADANGDIPANWVDSLGTGPIPWSVVASIAAGGSYSFLVPAGPNAGIWDVDPDDGSVSSRGSYPAGTVVSYTPDLFGADSYTFFMFVGRNTEAAGGVTDPAYPATVWDAYPLGTGERTNPAVRVAHDAIAQGADYFDGGTPGGLAAAALIDMITLDEGNLILLVNQSNPGADGIWRINGDPTSVAPTRAQNIGYYYSLPGGTLIAVREGSLAGAVYMVQNDTAVNTVASFVPLALAP